MAINKNHEFEDLDGVKCAVVEKSVAKERVAFLKDLLEYNHYKVIVVPSPPPKVAPAPKPVATAETTTDPVAVPVEPPAAPSIETSTIGVTNVMFNATNAIFGRLLKTKNGHIVTLAYWLQQETQSSDNIPYFSADENSKKWK